MQQKLIPKACQWCLAAVRVSAHQVSFPASPAVPPHTHTLARPLPPAGPVTFVCLAKGCPLPVREAVGRLLPAYVQLLEKFKELQVGAIVCLKRLQGRIPCVM